MPFAPALGNTVIGGACRYPHSPQHRIAMTRQRGTKVKIPIPCRQLDLRAESDTSQWLIHHPQHETEDRLVCCIDSQVARMCRRVEIGKPQVAHSRLTELRITRTCVVTERQSCLSSDTLPTRVEDRSSSVIPIAVGHAGNLACLTLDARATSVHPRRTAPVTVAVNGTGNFSGSPTHARTTRIDPGRPPKLPAAIFDTRIRTCVAAHTTPTGVDPGVTAEDPTAIGRALQPSRRATDATPTPVERRPAPCDSRTIQGPFFAAPEGEQEGPSQDQRDKWASNHEENLESVTELQIHA